MTGNFPVGYFLFVEYTLAIGAALEFELKASAVYGLPLGLASGLDAMCAVIF